MFAVGMLRSYLTQGVYAVGGPFQPFGGAVDIIVVEQKDGSFKSSPWYVKFGDFQGAFKSREKVVNISVNDVPTNFHMSLDFNGEAYFEKEVETPEINSHIEDNSLRPSSSSSDVIASKEAVYVEGNIISKKSSFEASNVFTYDETMNVNSEETQKKADDVAYHDGSENSIPNGHTDYSNGLEYSLSYNASIITENKEVYNSSNVADISFSGNSLSLLEPQKTEDATDSGIESLCTHNDGNIKIDLVCSTCYVNTMDIQADMSNLKYATHSELKIEATDNDGGDSMKLANDNMNIDRGHDTVFVELERQMLELKFKLESAQAETDMGGRIAYGFEQVKLDERETCNVENPRTDEFINLKKLKNGYATEADGSQVTENYAKNSESDSSWKVKESVVEINDFEKEETEEREEKEQKFVVSRVPSLSKWNLWPLSFRGSRTEKSCSNVSNHALLATTSMRAPTEDSLQKNGYYKWSKKNKIRTYVPTSSQLASLKLNDGPNKVTFVFTSVLGKTEVESRIYLWKWNTRIVISDVDGTITKSDVLGQVMPLIGRDWSQCGVTRLFSAIKDNGFEVLFLSARAITQAYLTRKFLLNLKQDGEALPEGPVFISPDGLLPSLYREVIRRAPHEFKISCLEAIRDLFPRDVNPFYAGFGNRITDEISYLKVGIPKGKIFIINPKGEVVVNNRVDCKSYTSLHALVDDMFPPFSSHEQEEFNSWNYWKVPFPDIDDEISGEKSKNSKKARK